MRILQLILHVTVSVASVWASQGHVHAKRETTATRTADLTITTADFEPSEVAAALDEWLSLFPVSQMVTVPTETLGIAIPHSLMGVILTAVPGSVVLQLIDPTARASVANEFQQGNTPGWYSSLPEEVKTFFEGMAGNIRTGTAVFTVASTPTAAPEEEGQGGEGGGTSTSEDAAMPTGLHRGVLGSAVGLAGVLGVALAL
ncbi:hypothetical protein B0T11DRAFT_337582 [Plectosphaerella cucumerina]|uniref:Uncharacterized protein n=1 Tax=Plectosphaerella cucumerina TaxID=40658 RepID=A0A8K0X611_9PEZI|nr:hypothetical protein B0T11DRAFT_337582 [Plectosphaerella cucumerina]